MDLPQPKPLPDSYKRGDYALPEQRSLMNLPQPKPLPDSYKRGDYALPEDRTSHQQGGVCVGLVSKRSASVIKQDVLAEFVRFKSLAARFKALGEQLRNALAQGALVEPGPLAVDYHVKDVRKLRVDYLIKQLGLSREEVAALRADAPASPYRYLTVRPSSRK